ncbi:fructosamine kinase family protein [Chryseolinea sp. H1M3-3]|uniref:fructosamine kinase family protein n=1 Tax=Chryseolinea sp. H1M3-3 TaxID=3034144 RepID=UPI0023ED5A51|nr:fructosamine kinase family protein [Chryseolinea sp. H1M3-3]
MISRVPVNVLEGVGELLKIPVSSFLDFSFISGGCINEGGQLKTSLGKFFLKWNNDKKFPGMFEAESRGLKLLRKQQAIKIPDVIGNGTRSPHQFLLLEFIEQKTQIKNYSQHLGQRLAALHRCTAPSFGLDHNNYIGSLQQFNQFHSSWIDFFINQRLNIQLKFAIDNGRVSPDWIQKFQSLYLKLPSLLPQEKPCLLHGDLWSGNLITDDKGEPCLIDPAVYYGNRESDLAMTKLFGGFDEEFYGSYDETFPLQSGYQKRADLYNLYPLLVHVNLFGGSYIHSVETILRAFK